MSVARLLKLAEILQNDDKALEKLNIQFLSYLKAHYVPDNDGKTPNPFRKNLDYGPWENSPYFGSVGDFMKKFPGGIKDWLDWRKKTRKNRYKKWDISKRKAHLISLAEEESPNLEMASFLLKTLVEQLKEQGLDDESIKKYLREEIFGEEKELNADDQDRFRGYIGNIDKDTLDNDFFRKIIFTGKNAQLVLMSLKPEEDIGTEVHKNVDQFFRIEEGEAKVVLNGVEEKLKDNGAIFVPAGTEHNITNTSKTKPLKLYTIYSPPNHPDGTIQKIKADAEADDGDVNVGDFIKAENFNNYVGEIVELKDRSGRKLAKIKVIFDRDDMNFPKDQPKLFDKHYWAPVKYLEKTDEGINRHLFNLTPHEFNTINLFNMEEIITPEKLEEMRKYWEKKAHYVPVGQDDTEKFPTEPHLYSGDNLGNYKDVKKFLSKYRKNIGKSQEADDAAQQAIKDIINYWKLLQKNKKRRRK